MAISPGPDFVMVSRNSLSYSKVSGIFTALGVATAIWIHVSYSIAGIAIVISNSILLFSIIKYLGAAYLLFSGYKTLTTHSILLSDNITEVPADTSTKFQSFKSGFMTNALNPKTTFFFLSIFSQVVTQNTPLVLQLLYGAIISIAHLVWFYLVAIFFSHDAVLGKFQKYQKQIQRIVGASLMAFGLKVALSKVD